MQSGNQDAFRLENTSLSFANGFRALQSLSLAIAPGEFVAILGPTGAGKSTLLRLLAGLLQPTGGRAMRQSKLLSFVFQDAHLLPWRTVAQNTALPLDLLRRPRSEWPAAVSQSLAGVGLTDFADFYPAALSGGMRMRASLARALVSQPEQILLDEPFGALDEVTRLALAQDLRRLWEKEKQTIVLVTHAISEAVFLANRVLFLSGRTRSIVADERIDLPVRRNRELLRADSYLQLVEDFRRRFIEMGKAS